MINRRRIAETRMHVGESPFPMGCGWMVLIAASNTALQTLSDNEKRGRVMSLFSTMIVGMAPFGSLLMGWAADQFGAPLVVAIGGGFCAR